MTLTDLESRSRIESSPLYNEDLAPASAGRRGRELIVEDLYLRNGAYEYSRGFNWCAVFALALGAGVALSGVAFPPLKFLYAYSWFVGFVVSFAAYYATMRTQAK